MDFISEHAITSPLRTITYSSDTDRLDDPELYASAYRAVSEYRRQKTDKFVFMKDRKLSLGVEILLRKALYDLGMEEGEIEFIKNGKPALKGSDICFNLSHSGTKVMCSVSDEDVGCDVEMIAPIDLNIARNYFYGSEYDTIAAAEGDSRYDLFYRFWTLKESFMKVTGLGFELPLDAFRIMLGNPITVDQDVDGRDYHFREFFLDDGYHYACCSVNRDIGPMLQVDLGNAIRTCMM